MKKFKVKKLPLIHQLAAIKENYPNTEQCSIVGNELIWIGFLRPTPMSDTYKVKVSYSIGEYPNIWVLSPSLTKRNGESIPHMYPQEKLCLFLPGEGSWRGDRFLANTIIPWTSEWLFFYEVWHATGQWLGGGVHPERPKKESKVGE